MTINNKQSKMKNRFFDFDPNKSFIELRSLWAVVHSMFAISAVISASIIFNSDLYYQPDYIGINNVLTIFKVPLGVLALIIPMVALLAANHRSVQTREQIKMTNSQNIFANHYKHAEEFEKYFKSHIKTIYSKNLQKTHSIVFPDTLQGQYEANPELIEQVELILQKVINSLKGFETDNYNVLGLMAEQLALISEVEDLCQCESSREEGMHFDYNGYNSVLPFTHFVVYFKFLKARIINISAIFKFDHIFVETASMKTLSAFSPKDVPNVDLSQNLPKPIAFNVFEI